MRQARWLLVVVLAGPGSVGAAGCGPASSGGALATEGSSSSDGSGPGSGTGEVSSTPSDDRLLVLPPLAPCDREAPIPARLRVATWNVGVGLQSSLGEVEAALAAVDADIVVVQEIEIGARRSGEIDQPAELAAALGYTVAFAAALQFDGGDYGLAVLSKLPFRDVDRVTLTSPDTYEPRIALDVTVCAGALPLRVVDVHADFVVSANRANLTAVAQHVGPVAEFTVVAGDFNATPETAGVVALLETTGAVDLFELRDPGPTREDERIDFMLASEALDARLDGVTRVVTTASDHALLLLDLRL